MLRVLEVGGGDEDGVDVLAGVEGFVVDDCIDGIAGELLDVGRAIFAAHHPDVGDGDDLEVHRFGGGQEGGDVTGSHAVAAADDTDAYAVVGADDFGVARCARRVAARGLRGGDGEGCGA